MRQSLNKWINIALVNLCIVALLGFSMRSKILFPLPFINFKYVLHAHSHFAFGGWVTLALLALMVYELLPAISGNKRVYKWLLAGILVNAVGMLASFMCQGYAFFSILFSVLFILVTYIFAAVFIRDFVKTDHSRAVKILAIGALVFLVLSSVGPFMLGYLMAVRSPNMYLYKDAVYTYLHLQYSGFFTLALFALLFRKLNADNRFIIRFTWLLAASVIPSMFLSFLWHYPGISLRIMACAGSLLLVAATLQFILMAKQLKLFTNSTLPFVKRITSLSLAAFVLKMLLQALTIIPSLGEQIFNNRPIIIGFLHLVLLGFITLYLFAHFIEKGLLHSDRTSRVAISIFIAGFLINEAVLMCQGLGAMFMLSSAVVQWLLWGASICLFAGALLIVKSKFNTPLFRITAYKNQNLKTIS